MSEEITPGTGSRILSFVIGLGVGLLVSMLFAPMSGEEARASLAYKANELKGRAAAAVENGKNMVADKKEQLSVAVDAGREVYKQEIGKAKAAGTDTVG
jgi:gas vesicle protein